VDRATATALLDALHEAQNEFYAGGPGAALRELLTLTDGTATIAGRERRWSTVGIYDVVGRSRISACWLLPFDQREFDSVWSS
jgi:hypothetical protein